MALTVRALERPQDVPETRWAALEAHARAQGHELFWLDVSHSGRYYDVWVKGENPPLYQIRRGGEER